MADRGEGLGAPESLLFLDQTEAWRAEKNGGGNPPHVRISMTGPPPYLKVWIWHCIVSQVLLTSIVATLSQHKTCKRLSSVTQEKHARSSNKTWQVHFLIQTPNQIKRQACQYLNFRSGIVHMFLVLGWFGWVLSKCQWQNTLKQRNQNIDWRRQCGQVVSALDSQSSSPGIKSPSGHFLDLFSVVPSSNPLPRL